MRKQQLFKQQLATRDDVENAEKDLSDAESTIKMLGEIGSIKDSEILTAPSGSRVRQYRSQEATGWRQDHRW